MIARFFVFLLPLALGSSLNPLDLTDTPTLCTSSNKGRCDCAQLAGSTDLFYKAGALTYTWMVNGEQRCMTVYVPSGSGKSVLNGTDASDGAALVGYARGNGPVPTLFFLQCYCKDALHGFEAHNTLEMADRFGMAVVYSSTPTGSWSWSDAVVNDKNPRSCSASSDAGGDDYTYMQDIFDWMSSQPTVFDTRVYSYGFSQNGMAAAYVGRCFSEYMTGQWTGGAGLYAHNIAGNPGGPVPPGHQGTCTDCKYWPVYPCHSSSENTAVQACIQAYSNDPLTVDQSSGTPRTKGHGIYLFNKLNENEGNDGRLMMFEADTAQGIKGEHHDPQNKYDWILGCFGGITRTCSSSCESALVSCVSSQSTSHYQAYKTCLTQKLVSSGECEAGCTPTFNMLAASEKPALSLTSKAQFGEPVELYSRPSSSLCEA